MAATPQNDAGRITGGRIARCECRRRGLADDGRSRLLQHLNDRRIRARPPAPIDRRAHFGRKIRCIDDVFDAHRDTAQRPGAYRVDGLGTTGKGADGSVMGADRFKRLVDRRIGRKIVGIDTALEFSERDHWHCSLTETGPLLRSMLAWGKRPSRHSGAMPTGPRKARPDDRLRIEPGISRFRVCATAHPGTTGVTPFPTPSG